MSEVREPPREPGPEPGPERDSARDALSPVVASRPSPNPFVLFGIGGANAASWLTGFLVGWLLDRHFHTLPVFIVIGLVVGVALGAVATYKEVRRYLNS